MNSIALLACREAEEALAKVQVAVVRHRVASAILRSQSEAALEASRIVLDRIERRPPTTFG